MLLYFGREFLKGRGSNLGTIRENLYRLAAAEHCVMVLMAFLTHDSPPLELHTQNVSVDKARM